MRLERLGRICALCAIMLPASVTGAALAQEASAPPGPGLASLPPGDLFTLGDPLAQFGQKLAASGVYLKGFYQGTLYSDVSGGMSRDTVYYSDALYGADFDLQKMAGLDGTVVHFSLDSRFGGFPQGVNNITGSAIGFLQGAGPSNVTRLNELSLDQYLFDGKVRFVVGRTTLANYFGTSDLYCQFVTTICSNIGPFNWSADSNAPFWPISTWAGEVAIWPTNDVYLRAGASESNPNQYLHGGFPWNGGWGIGDATGVFVPVEIGYMTTAGDDNYPRKYDIGFYYDSSDFPDFRYNMEGAKLAFAGGMPANDGSQTVTYAQAQQMIWRPDSSKSQGLTAFGAVMFNTSGRALIQSFEQAGFVLQGTFPGRPSDAVGLLFMNTVFNSRASGAVNDQIVAEGQSGHLPDSEQIVELNYDIEFAPGLHLKPYTDLTFHPDQNLFDITHPNPRNDFAWVVGAQFNLFFNDAFGLPGFFRPN